MTVAHPKALWDVQVFRNSRRFAKLPRCCFADVVFCRKGKVLKQKGILTASQEEWKSSNVCDRQRRFSFVFTVRFCTS